MLYTAAGLLYRQHNNPKPRIAIEEGVIVHIDSIRLAQDLIRIPSVTGDIAHGREAILVLQKALKKLGFETHPLQFGIGSDFTWNLYARLGQRLTSRCLAFAGHTDVVPVDDESAWMYPPFSGTIADGMLYGRGAEDMKASIAAFIAAVADYLEAHGAPRGTISFIISGNEEGVSVTGTRSVMNWMRGSGETFSAAIVGEPSGRDGVLGATAKIGCRGSLDATLTFQGKAGHVAYPTQTVNPLHRVIPWLNGLITNWKMDGTDHFEPTTIQVVDISTGNASFNVVPATCTVRLNIRFNANHTPESLTALLEGEAATVGLPVRVETAFFSRAYISPPGAFSALVQEACRQVLGITPNLTTVGGASDAAWLSEFGKPVLEFGPGNRTLHQVNECIALEDLEKLRRVYLRILESFFA